MASGGILNVKIIESSLGILTKITKNHFGLRFFCRFFVAILWLFKKISWVIDLKREISGNNKLIVKTRVIG